MRYRWGLIPLALSVALSGCGGGSGDSEQGADNEPDPVQNAPAFGYDGVGISVELPRDEGEVFSVIVGESVVIPIFVDRVEESIPVEVGLSAETNGISIVSNAGEFALLLDGALLPSDQNTAFTVVATNTEKSLDVSVAGVAVSLEPSTVVSGNFSETGGQLLSEDGSIALVIEPGQLAEEVTLELTAATDSSGNKKLRISSPWDLSQLDGVLRIERRVPAALSRPSRSSAPPLKRPARQGTTVGASSTFPYPSFTDFVQPYIGLYGTGFEFSRRIASNELRLRSWTLTCPQNTLNAILTQTEAQICVDEQDAARLLSTKPRECFQGGAVPDACGSAGQPLAYQPVLFVHGYRRGNQFSGGEGYWADFPGLAEELGRTISLGDADEIAAFEFRWRSNASFRVVARDLASAVNEIYAATQRPVHIVAHSFGGILVKTLLKSQEEGVFTEEIEFDPARVLSVLTIGTPHSGIFGSDAPASPLYNQTFPNGRDNPVNRWCNQISCWQMGVNDEDIVDPDEDIYDAGQVGEHLDRISNPSEPISSQIPLVVAIGLERDDILIATYGGGDKLISYDGQRASPDLAGGANLLRCGQSDLVTEVVLGTLDDEGLSPASRRPGRALGSEPLGYAHSAPSLPGRIFFSSPDSDEYSEAHVIACPETDTDCTPHASFEVFRKIVTDTTRNQELGVLSTYCVSSTENRTPSAPALESVVSPGGGSLVLSWSAPIGGLPDYSYEVFQLSDGLGAVSIGSTAETNFVVEGLELGTQYCFSVRATDSRANVSPRSDQLCGTPEITVAPTLPDAVEGWQAFDTGDPGIPNDGATVLGVACPAVGCGSRFHFFSNRVRVGPSNVPITISVYPARFGFTARLRFEGLPVSCSVRVVSLPPQGGDAPPFDQIEGKYIVIDQESLAALAETAQGRGPECSSALSSLLYVDLLEVSSGGAQLDGVFLANGPEVFPDDGREPIAQTPEWISFEEGASGVPDDGVVVSGQPAHNIVEVFPMGSADGLTLSLYGIGTELVDELVVRYVGFPDVCEFTFPLSVPLPSAPSIRGVEGQALSLLRSQLRLPIDVVSNLNPGSCAGVSLEDTYFAAFRLSGPQRVVDGAYLGVGANVVPEEEL